MGRLTGKVAFITGAARGQGRSHAIHLAREGADIIAIDICGQIESVQYPLGTLADLEETRREVETLGRRIVARSADVRNMAELEDALRVGTEEVGPVDILVANAGIAPQAVRELPNVWRDVIDVNLTGVFNSVEAVIPHMVAAGRGGSIVLIGSTAALTGVGGSTHAGLAYAAAKHGVVGLTRCYANNLAAHMIRVNSIHPCGVNTPIINNPVMQEFLAGVASRNEGMTNALPVGLIEPEDVSNALLWLVSDEARYVTGVALPVDAGFVNRN